MNDLLSDAQKTVHSLQSLQNSIRKTRLDMSGYVDVTDKKLHGSISDILSDQVNLVAKLNSYFHHSKPEHFKDYRKIFSRDD